MTLTAGTKLGPYEIVAPLGAGGMGEVYRARDSKLNRDVAIKVLLPVVANDPDRLARFSREAQVLASLNHPNIAHIHGLEEADGITALVLELVEGEDLAQRIARGAIPLDEALPIAKQIADALEAAHERGIIHRDLKPANIQVRPDGTVKVLDFGLAKAFETTGAGRPSSVSMSPTLTNATQMGMILGTAAYMAPEQARGKAVDKRADVWAFGCVLYEILAGQRAFGGDEVSDTLAFVITKDIDWNALPVDTPASIRRLLRRCLEKDPKRRQHDIADARIELDEPAGAAVQAADSGLSSGERREKPRGWRGAIVPATAVILASMLTGGIVWIVTRAAPAARVPVQRFPIGLPASAPYTGADGGLAISPDGTRLVYTGQDGTTRRQLYVRRLDQLEAQPLRGTDGASNPFFSPDGEWVGFFTGAGSPAGKLKKISVTGGPPLTISDANVPQGTWGADDTIVFGRFITTGWALFRVAAAGGSPARVTTPDASAKEGRHAWPDLLPDGKSLLFTVSNSSGGSSFDDAHIAVLSLATGTSRTIVPQGYHARYVSTGHIVYILGGNLMAVPFDVHRLETTGPAVPIVEGVLGRTNSGEAGFAVSPAGFLVYASGATSTTGGVPRSLVWVDRHGREEPIPTPARTFTYPRISPDGTRVALDIRDQENDIWVLDVSRHNLTRLTFDPGADNSPVWSGDGRHIFFGSTRTNGWGVYRQSADGTGQAERLTKNPNQQLPEAISPDGKRLLYRLTDPGSIDINMLSLDGDRKEIALLHSPFREQNADISADGKWIAYESDESGQAEIYVRPFPNVDAGRWQVSNGGGTRPVWARSGREMFYLHGSLSVQMMAVPVNAGATFSAGIAEKLFEGAYFATTARSQRTYDVSADAQRFLMIKEIVPQDASTPAAPLIVVLNWFDELKRLVPTGRR